MKNKLNIKIIFSISIFLFSIYFFILIFYIKGNMTIYVPPKEKETHLGIFSGVSNNFVDNYTYFSPGKQWEKVYNISPKNGDATGPLQIYHLENKNKNKEDNHIFISYFQRDNTTDINIDIISLDPPCMSVKEMTWILDDF